MDENDAQENVRPRGNVHVLPVEPPYPEGPLASRGIDASLRIAARSKTMARIRALREEATRLEQALDRGEW